MPKPGACLPWESGKACVAPVTPCKNDWECERLQKCCASACGTICQEPCHSECDIACPNGQECKVVNGCAKCVAAYGAPPKAGNCMHWSGASISLKNCESDYNCPGSKKCCSVGEGRLCQDPCPTKCDWACLSGTKCVVGSDGCAQCAPSST